MRRYSLVMPLAVASFVVGPRDANAFDMEKVTCQAFLASGSANMAAMIMWLRGYHAGKGGTIAFTVHNPYGGRLGHYCKNHPAESVIGASEQILTDLDRGI